MHSNDQDKNPNSKKKTIIFPPLVNLVAVSDIIKSQKAKQYGTNSFLSSNYKYKPRTFEKPVSRGPPDYTLTAQELDKDDSSDDLTDAFKSMKISKPVIKPMSPKPIVKIDSAAVYDSLFDGFEHLDIDVSMYRAHESLNITLLPHQIRGVVWMQSMELQGKGILLADDMGLGTIALIVISPGVTLIVCPLAVLDQWKIEIDSKCSSLKVYVHHGPKRSASCRVFDGFHVVLTTYDVLAREMDNPQSLLAYEWHRVVLDESHVIKNWKTVKAKSCFALKAKSRVCLTGTPLQNTIEELYSLFLFLRHSEFSEYSTFKDRFVKSKANIIPLLKKALGDFTIRRTKVVLKDLPPRIIKLIHLDFATKIESERYRCLEERSMRIIRNGELKYTQMCVLFLRLRQACDHPFLGFDLNNLTKTTIKKDSIEFLIDKMNETSLTDSRICACGFDTVEGQQNCIACIKEDFMLNYDEIRNTISTKTQKTIDILSRNAKNKDRNKNPIKTIIFTQFVQMILILEKHLAETGIQILKYTGDMNTDRRNEALNTFKSSPTHNVIIISLLAGSCGLNLSVASHVILFDMWYNPSVEEQCIDRVHRMGQLNTVFVHKLIINNTVERRVLKMQDAKRELAKRLLGSKETKDQSDIKLDMAELKNLIMV